MTTAILLAIVVFLVVGVMLSRRTATTKKQAIADLKEEKESVGTFDILALVDSEVEALGLTGIDGATDIPHGVLLKIWRDNQDIVESCVDRQHLSYVVTPGVEPSNATEADVSMECSGTKPENASDDSQNPDA